MSAQPPNIQDYTLLRCIGRGSYGEVWLARGVTGVYRALKIVHRSSFSEYRPYEREFSGIQKFQTVSHSQENLVNILHVGRNDEAGYFFYVMELADPADLVTSPARQPAVELNPATYESGTLKQLQRTRGRLPVAECTALAKGLARAVEHLHENGLIHRDIKPSNIIFVNGVPKLADIGLVAGMDESRSFVGTEGFVPPEGPGTISSDLFALGRLLYEMATGRDRLDFPKLPDNLDELPDRAALLEFNEVMLKAGDPDRARRYSSAAELVRDLQLLEAGKSVRRLRLLESRFALALRTAAVATVVTVIAIVAWLWATHQAGEAKRNFAESERNRAKAEAALRDVLLNQVRANRQSGWAGQRIESLRMLRENPSLTNSLTFRNEAIACLALPDVRPLREIALPRGIQTGLDRNLTRYATNDASGAIYVRSVDDNRLLNLLPSPGVAVFRLGFSEDDQTIGASYLNLRFIAWKLELFPAPSTNAPLLQWADLPTNIQPTRIRLPMGAFAGTGLPDGSELAVQCGDGSIHFLNPTNGAESRVLRSDFPRAGIRFNTSGLKFASVQSNDCVVFRTETGERLLRLSHPGPVSALAWHPDGRRLATTCFDLRMRLWDTVTGQQLRSYEEHEAEPIDVKFDPTGTMIISSCWDNTTRLWAPDSARALVRVRGSGNGIRVAADAQRLSYTTWDHSRLVVQEVLPGRELTSLEHFTGIYRFAFSPDGQFIAANSASGLHLWQWPFFHPVATLPVWDSGSAVFLPDGRSLLAGGAGMAAEWPFEVDRLNNTLRIGPARELASIAAHHFGLVALSEDATLASLSTDSRTRIFARETNGWRLAKSIPGKSAMAIFSPDNRWLAVAQQPNRLELFTPQAEAVTNLACISSDHARFSADGRWLVGLASDGYQFRHVGTWEKGPLIPRDASSIRRETISFCRSNRLVALRTADRELSLVDQDSWETVAVLPIPLYTTSVAFSPDGSKLAVSTEKLGIKVWDLALLREGLSAMNLDWTGKHSPTKPAPPAPVMLQPLVQVHAARATNSIPQLRLPTRDSATRPELIDLSSYYNGNAHAGWIPGFALGATAEHSLPIPLGTNTWAGIDFDVRGVIQVQSSILAARKGKFPDQVSGIPVNRRGRLLHFLHGTDWSVKPGTVIGEYVVRYVNGTEEYIPITFGHDVFDWWQEPDAANTKLQVAWVGANVASQKQNNSIRVYRSSWENPRWDVPIQSIDFISAKTACGPFLLAITIE